MLAWGVPCARAQDQLPPGANTTCPVKGDEPVDLGVFTVYDGRRVYFCCETCRSKFEREPAAYIREVSMRRGPEAAPDSSAAAVGESWMTRSAWARLVGRMHPVLVHFPIGLLIVAAGVELLAGMSGRARVVRSARVCLALGVLGALAAAGAGWIRAEGQSYDGSSVLTAQWHRWVGVAASGLALLAAMLGAGVGERMSTVRVMVYRLTLLGAAVTVGVAGHFGGMLVHGEGYYWSVLRPGAATPAGSAQAGGAGTAGPPSDTTGLALFAASNDELMIRRRQARLALLPPAPRVPAAQPGMHNEVDRFIVGSWMKAGLPQARTPPPVCDDATFARRVYLDVIGVIPTIEELTRFLGDARPDKRDALIDELLGRNDDYADHWTPFWEDALGSSPVALRGGIPTRGSYTGWIRRAFRENTPYDVFAASLLDPSMPGHQAGVLADANGRKSRVQFVLNETHVDTLQTAAAVGQVFLGSAMKCAGCHNHFENPEWPQARFLGFAGLFTDHDLEVIRCEKKSGQTVPAAFVFELPGAPRDVPEGEEARLRRAAQLLTDPLNPRFARAIVNRLWKRYLGLGLFEPADDYRLDRSSSHPELLDWLADDFMRHGYDLKHTIRLILTSRTYQLRYDPALEDHFDVSKPGEPRYYRSPSLRRLTAEQLVDSVRVATTQRLEPASRLYRDTGSTALTRALGKPAARNEISTNRPDDVAVVQALELLNGEEWRALTRSGRLAGMALACPDPAEAADLLFRAVLSRPASPAEAEAVARFAGESWSRASEGPREEVTWCDDELPMGAMPTETWRWVESSEFPPARGGRSHIQGSPAMGPRSQHYMLGATAAMNVGPADTLFTYVYLDPADPPREVMIQWNDGTGIDGGWGHRAYWGHDVIPYGTDGTPSRRRMGPLPEPGRWVRLEVPAAEVGLENTRVVGMSFDQAGGVVHWDMSGVVRVPVPPGADDAADVLWSLFSGPEFQYFR
jgi:uncharacterized membrane protein